EEDFEEIILQCLEFPDQEEHVELTKQTIEKFRKKAEAQGLFNISTNKEKELWKEPIKNARYCNGECNSIFSEDNHIYFETNNQEAYCKYCYFTECQTPEEKENRRCQECTQTGTSKFIERIEEIEWRQEIKNLKRSLDEIKAENLILCNLVETYVFNERNIYRSDIKFYDEMCNLYRTRADNTEHHLASTRVAYHNIYLQTIEDQYINLDRS
ncbi:20517_t:CDS:2, partial [Gigaspora rosea]